MSPQPSSPCPVPAARGFETRGWVKAVAAPCALSLRSKFTPFRSRVNPRIPTRSVRWALLWVAAITLEMHLLAKAELRVSGEFLRRDKTYLAIRTIYRTFLHLAGDRLSLQRKDSPPTRPGLRGD